MEDEVASEGAPRDQHEVLAEKFNRIFNGLIPMATYNGSGRYLSVNDAYCRLFGRSRQWFLEHTYVDISHPDEREGDLNLLARSDLNMDKGYRRHKRYLHADGHLIWAEVNLVRVPIGDGDVHTITQIRDLTVILSDRQDLADAQRRLEISQANAHIGTWEQNEKTGERVWSREHKRLFGLHPDGPTPTFEEFLDSVHPDDRHLVVESGKNREPYEITYRAVLPTGETRWFRSTGDVLFDDAGEPEWFFGTAVDITSSQITEPRK